jgi:hypothetical protein
MTSEIVLLIREKAFQAAKNGMAMGIRSQLTTDLSSHDFKHNALNSKFVGLLDYAVFVFRIQRVQDESILLIFDELLQRNTAVQ